LDTLEDVLTSQRTQALPVVHERLLGVLAAAAYASFATSFKLWRKLKPPENPDEVSLIPCVQVHSSQY
jgi:hypothetical protein